MLTPELTGAEKWQASLEKICLEWIKSFLENSFSI